MRGGGQHPRIQWTTSPVPGIIAVILTARTGHLHHPVLDIIDESRRAGHGGQVSVGIRGVAGAVDAVGGLIKTQLDGRFRALGHGLGGAFAKAIIGKRQSPVGPAGAGRRQARGWRSPDPDLT